MRAIELVVLFDFFCSGATIFNHGFRGFEVKKAEMARNVLEFGFKLEFGLGILQLTSYVFNSLRE